MKQEKRAILKRQTAKALSSKVLKFLYNIFMRVIESASDNNLRVKPPSKRFIISTLALSIAGFIDATYLTIKHYSHSAVNCSIFDGCEFVTTSFYSTMLGIPVALLGVAFYALVFIFIFLFSKSANKKFLVSLLAISTVGFLASMWFVYIQAFILKAFCFYCLISASLSATLFIISLIITIQYKKHETNS